MQIIQLAGMVPIIILSLLIPSRTCPASLTVETPPHLGYHKHYTVSSLILRTSVNSASPTKFTLPIGVKPGVAVSSCCLFHPLELILADQSQICQIPWISSDGTSQLMSAWVWPFFLSLLHFDSGPVGGFLTPMQALPWAKGLYSPLPNAFQTLPCTSKRTFNQREVPWAHKATPPCSKVELLALYSPPSQYTHLYTHPTHTHHLFNLSSPTGICHIYWASM